MSNFILHTSIFWVFYCATHSLFLNVFVCPCVLNLYLWGACVLLVQRVILAALLLILLMIDLQLLSHLLYTVLLHQLRRAKKCRLKQSVTMKHKSRRLCLLLFIYLWWYKVCKVNLRLIKKQTTYYKKLHNLQHHQPAGIWRRGTGAWCPAWHCTGPGTHGGSDWWAPLQTGR